jgi:hypothetical protein
MMFPKKTKKTYATYAVCTGRTGVLNFSRKRLFSSLVKRYLQPVQPMQKPSGATCLSVDELLRIHQARRLVNGRIAK